MLETVRKIASASNFRRAFCGISDSNVTLARPNQERIRRTDYVTRQAPVRGDLCRAAGLRGDIKRYRRWEESPARQDGEKSSFAAAREDPSPDNNCYTRVRIRLNNHEEGGNQLDFVDVKSLPSHSPRHSRLT